MNINISLRFEADEVMLSTNKESPSMLPKIQ